MSWLALTTGLALSMGWVSLRNDAVAAAETKAAETKAADTKDAATVTIKLAGAIAMATFEEPLPGQATTGEELRFDIVPPVGAGLWDVALLQGGRWKSVDPAANGGAAASRAYDEALRAMHVEKNPGDVDDELRFRVRIAAPTQAARPSRVRYRLAIPVAVGAKGLFRVAFPASPDSPGVMARVHVEAPNTSGIGAIALGADERRFREGQPRVFQGRVDLRGSWEVTFEGGNVPGGASKPSTAAPVSALFSVAPEGARPDGVRPDGATSRPLVPSTARRSHLAYTAYAPGREAPPLPSHVLFVVDRSRSVGLGGLAVERDMIHELLDRLPRSTRFQVLFFGRTTKALFMAPRAATVEALASLDEAMLPELLENGSDFLAAATAAGEALRRQAATETGRAWMVLLTDGAFFGPPIAESAYARAFGELGGVPLGVAAFAVRAREDAAFPDNGEARLRAWTGGTGAAAVVRLLRENDKKDGVADAIADLQAGGDLTTLGLKLGNESRALRSALPPNEGAQALLTLPSLDDRKGGRATLVWRRAGRNEEMPARLERVEPGAVAALLGPPVARVSATPWLAVLVEPLIAPPPPAAATPAVGSLERSVVRDHLSLRFLPRARACYQRRTGPTPALRDLEGRVRLALDLARGELEGAEVLSSTLGRGDDGSPVVTTALERAEVDKVLSCLQEAAFTLDVPPTYMNDEGVRAVLNLHFHPYRQEKRGELDREVARELDVLLEGQQARAPASDQKEQTADAPRAPAFETATVPAQGPAPPTALP